MRHNLVIIIGNKITLYIEYVTRPIIFFIMPLWPKNSHVFGLDFEILGFVVTKRCQDVPWSWLCFSVPKDDGFSNNSAILQLVGRAPLICD